MTLTQQTPTVVVALVTYRRTDELRHTLPLVLEQAATAPFPARVLVVDNDPDGSAEAVIADFRDDPVSYVPEPHPGIAAARNRALDTATEDDLLIFIDDDETPGERWLEHMVRTYREHGSTGVVGPVDSDFDGDLDEWIRAGGFFERRRLTTGTAIDVAATNNLLLDLAAIRQLGLRFDEAFGLTGGSDTLFTRELARRGGTMVWCAEAGVTDHVPAGRMTRRWVLMRAMRYGNSWSRTSIVLAAPGLDRLIVRSRMIGQGAARVVAGCARLLGGAVVRSTRHEARGRRTLMKGVGYIRGALGSAYTEYARTAAGPAASSAAPAA